MVRRSHPPPVAGADAASTAAAGFFRRFIRLSAPYWRGTDRWRVGWSTLSLALLTAVMVALAIRLNLWSADLFNALETKSMDRFLLEVGVFVLLVFANTATVTLHLALKRRIQVDWRRWLTRHLIGEWMDQARQYQIGLMPGDHGNPDGRIAEDIRIATETAIELAHSMLYSLLLLLSFIGILWTLSGVIVIPIDGIGFDLPGHMVWLAFLYSLLGGTLAFILGRPLVRSTDMRQTVEADFRFTLAQGREHAEAIALLDGEPEERRRLAVLFDAIRDIWDRQTASLWRLMAFSSTFNMVWTMLPILVSTPRYLAGSITLGGLMQTAQAFQQVTAALSWPVDNFAKVAEWRASVERVLALHDATEDVRDDITHSAAHTIKVERVNGPALTFRRLDIAMPDGRALFTGIDVEIMPGDRVLIGGDPKAAEALFKVVARVWPWGHGTVELPDDAAILLMPEQPYLPTLALRAVLAYPEPAAGENDVAMADALRRVGLDALVPRLAEVARWDQTLSGAEQQRLGFARLLLCRPTWIFLQEATSILDPADEAVMMRLLDEEFPQATVLTIGHHPGLEAFHRRKLTLERASDGAIFVRESWPRRTGPGTQTGSGWRVLEWLRSGYGHEG